MSDKPRLHPRLHQLFDAACDGRLTPEETVELESWLRGDGEAQRLYRQYCQLHVELHFLLCGDRVREAVQAKLEPPRRCSSRWKRCCRRSRDVRTWFTGGSWWRD